MRLIDSYQYQFTLLVTAWLLASTGSQAADSLAFRFEQGSWTQLLATTARRHQLLLVEVYADWCVPCRQMRQQAFPDSAVGQLINRHFVACQLNAETEPARRLLHTYRVNVYPTLLLVNSRGELLDRIEGYTSPAWLLTQLQQSLQRIQASSILATWARAFRAGRRDGAFLTAYLNRIQQLGLAGGPVLDAYLSRFTSAHPPSGSVLVSLAKGVGSAHTMAYDWLLTYIARHVRSKSPDQLYYNGQLINYLWTALEWDYQQAINQRSDPLFAHYLRHYQRLYQLDVNTVKNRVALMNQLADRQRQFYRGTKNMSRYQPLARAYARRLMQQAKDSLLYQDSLSYNAFLSRIRSLPDTIRQQIYQQQGPQWARRQSNYVAADLAHLAQVYTELPVDSLAVCEALDWVQRALDLQRKTAYQLVFAQLLTKLNRRPEAIVQLQYALNRAILTGEPTQDFVNELAKLD